jgi:predicted CXXCH cytochrome family protein
VLLEWLVAAIGIALSVRLLGLRERYSLALLLGMIVSGAAAAVATTSARRPPPSSPVAARAEGFTTSGACRSCHPAEYSSWHASYHRRMTQPADVDAVAPALLRQGGRLRAEVLGRSVELFADGHRLWAEVPDPEATSSVVPESYEATFRAVPSRAVPVQLLTGSHHQQAFWVSGARSGELRALPVVYLIAEQRLIPRRDAFLNPPEAPEHAVRWNSNCVQCHTVAGAPAHDEARDVFESSAAELGVACEACHGAGDEHVRAMQNPLRRQRAHEGDAAIAIVNPTRLDPARGSQVCGRCHSYFFPKNEAKWWQSGFVETYRPGGDLSAAQLLLSPEVLKGEDAPQLAASAESLFYADGTIRVAGREYNGLVRSPCYERGSGKRQLTCFSCHSLHRSAPADQLGADMDGNEACLGCHEDLRGRETAHTRHSVTSAGNLCYNCHMPHTTYALLGAVRSHRVDSPSFDERTRDRPNACNLCHLEKSEAWAASQVSSWFGEDARFTLSRGAALENTDLPAAAVFALSGDAAVRAITAAALGRAESSDAAVALRRQLLGTLASDDYAAVRHIAARSLTTLPAATGSPLEAAVVQRLLGQRDRRPVTIAE